jgi:hypothetical protein
MATASKPDENTSVLWSTSRTSASVPTMCMPMSSMCTTGAASRSIL